VIYLFIYKSNSNWPIWLSIAHSGFIICCLAYEIC